MAKRVLGNDPFSNDRPGEPPAEEPGAARVSKRPASRTSKTPASPASVPRASKRPGAKSSKARSTEELATPSVSSGKVHTSADEARVPSPPPLPRDLAAAQEDAEPTGVEESAAPADLPPDLRREEPAGPAAEERADAVVIGDIEDQIREIEARLDRLLQDARSRGEVAGRLVHRLRACISSEAGEGAASEAGAVESSSAPAPVREESKVFDVARELLSSDYYLRQWGRIAMRDRSEEVDEFGLDPKYAARVRPLFELLYERWWRVEVKGIEKVPSEGRVILCANHSGALPWDGVMLAMALRREHPAHRELRWLAEDFIFHFPFLGAFMNRIGAVRACQENAERLLRQASVVGVFPEGVKGISKLYRERYRLQRFGRGGHVKLAIRTRTPIVPVAILGAEETHPLLARSGALAKLLGLPYVPITPTFPLLGPFGLIPAPSKWKMFFLEPIAMEAYAPESADDEVLVGRLNEKIRTIIQDQLDRALRERRSVFRG